MAINIKQPPQWLKIVLLVVPAVLIAILFFALVFFPKNTQVKQLNIEIQTLNGEIQRAEVKLKKLDELIVENKRLQKELERLKEQLPSEQEVSVLLKQVSDLALKAGLDILLWRPEARRSSASGLYVEIPVSVHAVGRYHDLGQFYSYISQIKRIVNVSGISISNPKLDGDYYIIDANFTASTFSYIEGQ